MCGNGAFLGAFHEVQWRLDVINGEFVYYVRMIDVGLSACYKVFDDVHQNICKANMFFLILIIYECEE